MPGTSSSVVMDTAADLDEASHPAAMWVRRTALTVMTLVVAADLTGLLGVHTSETTASRDGYTLTLRYPGVARAGLGRSR